MTQGEGRAEFRHIVVQRTARYAMLGQLSADVREVWVVCHGYAQLAEGFIERFRCIASSERLIVAPEALSRFYSERGGGFHGSSSKVGASWMTAADRESEIADYISYLDALHDEIFLTVSRKTTVLRVLGFSQGASTVGRWIAAGRVKADQVIIWAGSLPAELDRAGAAKLNGDGRAVLIVAGDSDQFITSKILDIQLSTLAGLGVNSEVRRFSGGHELDPSTLSAIATDWGANRR